MKELYAFSLNAKEGTEDKSSRLILAQPKPRQFEESEFEFSATMSGFVRQGIMTRAMLFKKYEDQGGLLPDSVRMEQLENQKNYYEKGSEIVRLESKKVKTPAEKEKILKLSGEIGDLRRAMIQMEQLFDSVYNHTADRLTQTKMVYWWLFELAYKQDEDEAAPVKIFNKGNYEANRDLFFEITEDESDLAKAIKTRLFGLVSFWYYGDRVTKEDMDGFIKDYLTDAPKTEEGPEPDVSVIEEPTATAEEAPQPPKKAGRPTKK